VGGYELEKEKKISLEGKNQEIDLKIKENIENNEENYK
jgi:hypothetical protein